MKKGFITIAAMMFIIAISSGLFADTIIDSVYANVQLDGSLFFRQSIQQVVLYLWVIGAGDTGESLIASDPNSIFRGYISFELPQIPEGYVLDSVYVRLYQYASIGDGDIIGNQEPYPLFYGQELPCIMDHIDYGYQLDPSDWTKGDPGDPGTIHTNIGVISDSAEVGYRYLDITDYVREDYINGRDKTQYRIRFEVDTDWDNKSDNLGFRTTGFGPVTAPLIFLYFTSTTPVEKDRIEIFSDIKSYPNPFNSNTNISFYLKNSASVDISIFDIKGRLVRKLVAAEIFNNGKNTISWDGKNDEGKLMSSGIYFCRFTTKQNQDNLYLLKLVYIK